MATDEEKIKDYNQVVQQSKRLLWQLNQRRLFLFKKAEDEVRIGKISNETLSSYRTLVLEKEQKIETVLALALDVTFKSIKRAKSQITKYNLNNATKLMKEIDTIYQGLLACQILLNSWNKLLIDPGKNFVKKGSQGELMILIANTQRFEDETNKTMSLIELSTQAYQYFNEIDNEIQGMRRVRGGQDKEKLVISLLGLLGLSVAEGNVIINAVGPDWMVATHVIFASLMAMTALTVSTQAAFSMFRRATE